MIKNSDYGFPTRDAINYVTDGQGTAVDPDKVSVSKTYVSTQPSTVNYSYGKAKASVNISVRDNADSEMGQVRRYNQTADTLDRTQPELDLTPFPEGITSIDPKATQQLAWVGGQLTKQKGSLLTYEATAQFGFLGPAAGDVDRKSTRLNSSHWS